MTKQTQLGGTFKFPGTTLPVYRIGYGAMQLAGPHVFGPPSDRPEAIAVLREGHRLRRQPYRHQRLLRSARHQPGHQGSPCILYPEDLTLVTKVGARRGDDGSWILDRSRENLVESIHDNLRNLGLEALDIVNLRMGGFSSPPPNPDRLQTL